MNIKFEEDFYENLQLILQEIECIENCKDLYLLNSYYSQLDYLISKIKLFEVINEEFIYFRLSNIKLIKNFCNLFLDIYKSRIEDEIDGKTSDTKISEKISESEFILIPGLNDKISLINNKE